MRNKYNIPKNTLNDWFKNYNFFKNEKNDKIKRISGGRRKSNLEEFKKDLLYYILDIRRSGFAINVKTIIAYLYSINDNFKKENIHSLEMKIRRFLERNNLRIRKASHIGQPLPDNATDLIYEYLYKIINKRRILNINDSELFRIINCDETAIYFENPSTKTIDVKGLKEIIINIDGNEDKKISALLSITADGRKLPPFLIFKGKEDKIIEKELSSNYHVKKKNIFAVCQNRGWCDTNIFLKWYKNIFLYYEQFVAKKPCLLILDKAPSHYNDKISNEFNINRTNYIYIPGGLTRYLQPLDIGINMPFKKALQFKYIEEKTLNFSGNNKILVNIKQKREHIIDVVNTIWNGSEIKKETIINSFWKAGISLLQDGSEDEKWEFPKTIIDNYTLYDDFENSLKL